MKFIPYVIFLSLLSSCPPLEPPKYTLSVSGVLGTVVLSPSQDYYLEGTVVKVSIFPNSGAKFTHWEGALNDTRKVLQISMRENLSLTGVCVASPWPAWPDATNTGVPTGTVLTNYTGSNQTTADGQVFENLTIGKRIYINHTDVVFRNCLLTGGADPYYVIYTNPEGANLTLERCEITNGVRIEQGFTGRGNHIHAPVGGGKDDGFVLNASDVLLENNLIEGLEGADGAHLDGIQVMGGDNIVIRNNWIEATTLTPIADSATSNGGVNAALFFKPDQGPIFNLLIQHNRFIQDEGYYPLRIHYASGQVQVEDNLWSTVRHGLGAPFNLVSTSPTRWSGNAYDTGGVINLP